MKKLLAVLAVVALVAISFTSCNNGTPAPSATIPAEMYGNMGRFLRGNNSGNFS